MTIVNDSLDEVLNARGSFVKSTTKSPLNDRSVTEVFVSSQHVNKTTSMCNLDRSTTKSATMLRKKKSKHPKKLDAEKSLCAMKELMTSRDISKA